MKHLSLLLPALLAMQAAAAATLEACKAFKWDVSQEVQLYHTAPTALAAGTAATAAPAIDVDRFYALTLSPQESVAFKVSSGKRMLSDGAYAGVLRLRVAQAGAYRIAIDSGFWLDVVQDGQPLRSIDFNGSQDCEGPHKIVVYMLPAGVDLYVQLSAASGPQVRLSVTRVATAS